jgi:hypothetical protein
MTHPPPETPPPEIPPPEAPPPEAAHPRRPVPGLADPPDLGDLAGLDPDPEGLDLDGLADRDEPSNAELAGLDYEPDDDTDEGAGLWLAAAASGLGAGFSDGGVLDGLRPGAALAGFSQHALDDGLAALPDDALVGLLRASRRLSAWQSGVELAAVAELDHRRLRQSSRPGWSRVSEHIATELAAALVLTGRTADSLLGLARDLDRLPAVRNALLAGLIDRARAAIFAEELAALTAPAANTAAAAFLPHAPGLTTGQLRAALRALVHRIDPSAVRRRMSKARDDTRVEAWQEISGNVALAGRELDPADAIAADRRITAIARALQTAGASGTLDQLRAAVFTALLAGRDPGTLRPEGPDTTAHRQDQPAADPGNPDAAGPSSPAGPAGAGGLAALGGSVHLTLPASTWLGLTDLPGEAAGLGPIDAWTSRDLASRLAAARGLARWCVTLTRPDGRAAAHACARAGPPPPGGIATRRAWLTRQHFTWLDPGRCGHGSQTRGYRPPNLVGHLIRARNRTCTFPGCRRPATSCDLDHTIPYDQGGPTCPCNLAPACRQHHQVKQAPGWTLAQPQPGTLTWTAPHGRSYTVTPSTYPC